MERYNILTKQIAHGGSTSGKSWTRCMRKDKYIPEGQLWWKAWLVERVKYMISLCSLRSVVLGDGAKFAPRGHLDLSGRRFWLSPLEGGWCCWHPVGRDPSGRHRAAPTTKNDPAPYVNKCHQGGKPTLDKIHVFAPKVLRKEVASFRDRPAHLWLTRDIEMGAANGLENDVFSGQRGDLVFAQEMSASPFSMAKVGRSKIKFIPNSQHSYKLLYFGINVT